MYNYCLLHYYFLLFVPLKPNDDDEESSTTMTNRASNKTAGFCISGCGLRGALGCVCNGESNKCECPGKL